MSQFCVFLSFFLSVYLSVYFIFYFKSFFLLSIYLSTWLVFIQLIPFPFLYLTRLAYSHVSTYLLSFFLSFWLYFSLVINLSVKYTLRKKYLWTENRSNDLHTPAQTVVTEKNITAFEIKLRLFLSLQHQKSNLETNQFEHCTNEAQR